MNPILFEAKPISEYRNALLSRFELSRFERSLAYADLVISSKLLPLVSGPKIVRIIAPIQ